MMEIAGDRSSYFDGQTGLANTAWTGNGYQARFVVLKKATQRGYFRTPTDKGRQVGW